MLFLTAGLPGRFGQWCQAAIARAAPQPIDAIRADTLEELAIANIRGSGSFAALACRCPGGRLRLALAAAGRNFIVAVDDPWTALAQAVVQDGVDFVAGVKAVASTCAATLSYCETPGSLVLAADPHAGDKRATAAAILQHLRIPAEEAVLAELAAGAAPADDGAAAAWREALAEADRETAQGAFGAFADPSAAMEPARFQWTPALFEPGDHPGVPAVRPIDITGRARCLLHGPGILLPPGSWLARLDIVFSAEATEHDFDIEIVADHQLAYRRFRPASAGPAALDFTFTLAELSERPVSLRLSSLRAAFDGTLAITGATLARQSP